jgi:hypothetical protein
MIGASEFLVKVKSAYVLQHDAVKTYGEVEV